MPEPQPDKVDVYMALFRGRTDVYARRWENTKKGIAGYAPVRQGDFESNGTARRQNKSAAYVPLMKVALIEQHLQGEDVLGVYPLLTDNTCWFLAFDFDGERAFEEAKELHAVCDVQELPAYLERSRSGNYHLWIFFEAPIAAWKARRAGFELLKEAGLVGEGTKAEEHAFDRMFPNQDAHSGKGLGNLIALPLQRDAALQGRTEFLDTANGFAPFENQWVFLRSVRRVSEAQLLGIALMQDVDLTAPAACLSGRQAPAPAAGGSRLGRRLRAALRNDEEQEAALRRLCAECVFMKHCRDQARTLPEKDWWALASNLAPFGEPGRKVFHELSQDYPGYDRAEADAKFDRQLEDPKPHTCAVIREKVWDCGRDCGVRSPCALPFKRPAEEGAPADLEAAIDAIPNGASGEDLEAAIAPVLRGLALLLDEGERSRLLGLLATRSGLGRTGLGVRVADAQEKEDVRRTAATRRGAALPQIVVNNRQLRDVIADAWAALHAANDPPVVFRRSGHLVRLGVDEHGLKIQSLDEAAAYGRLARVADWLRLRKDEPPVQVSPPKDVARDLLAYPDAGVAHLEAVVTAPFFGCSGELVARPGYHAGDRVWLDAPPDLIGLEVPRQPSPDDVAGARRVLVDDLLLDFPFVEPSDCAHMVAALMLPFVRRLVAGVTPIHLVEAPAVGSGKGLLCSLVEVLATGTTSVARTLPVNEDEARKLLTAEITLGRGVILLDNASERRRLDCAPLASVLTSEFWTDRILGRTEMTTLPNRAVWLLTANNPEMSMELARRCVRIRIDPRVDRPWLRDQFKHRHLVRWAKQHRVELVRAVLVLVQSWLAAGRPPGAMLLGSFEGWSEVLGGILAHAGIAGFLANLEELYERADVEGQQWREFTSAWHARFGDQPVKVAQLFELCQESDLLAPVLGEKSERSQLTRLGTALRRAKDRVFSDLRVTLAQDSSHKGRLYALEAVPPAPAS